MTNTKDILSHFADLLKSPDHDARIVLGTKRAFWDTFNEEWVVQETKNNQVKTVLRTTSQYDAVLSLIEEY